MTLSFTSIELEAGKVEDMTSSDQLKKTVKASIGSKQFGNEDLLTDLVVEAALNVMPKDPRNFNVDSIRVVKVMGSSIYDSKVVRGMVFGREPEGKDLTLVVIWDIYMSLQN